MANNVVDKAAPAANTATYGRFAKLVNTTPRMPIATVITSISAAILPALAFSIIFTAAPIANIIAITTPKPIAIVGRSEIKAPRATHGGISKYIDTTNANILAATLTV